MASLIAFVDAEALRELRRGRPRSPGAAWRIEAGDLPHPQLGLLDADGLLVVVTVEARCAVAVAALEGATVEDHVFRGGDAIELDHDISHILPRLGYRDAAALAAAIAREPTHLVLAPEQVDVLRYELDIFLFPEDAGAAAPGHTPLEVAVEDDAETLALRDAVWRDPGSDLARHRYADRLQELGDPRGELISLQLAREDTGAGPTNRERALLERVGARLAEPLGAWVTSYELRRGFVGSVTVATPDLPEASAHPYRDRGAVPPVAVEHPAWATVEAIATDCAVLATSPALVSARRLATSLDLATLAAAPQPLAYVTIVGPGGAGLPVPEGARRSWAGVLEIGALTKLRVLSLRATGLDPKFVAALAGSPLGAQLARLDLRLDAPDAALERRARDAAVRHDLRMLSIRRGGLVYARERTRLAVELAAATDAAAARALAATLVDFGAGLARLELHDAGARTYAELAARQDPLLDILRRTFTEVFTFEAGRRPSLAL